MLSPEKLYEAMVPLNLERSRPSNGLRNHILQIKALFVYLFVRSFIHPFIQSEKYKPVNLIIYFSLFIGYSFIIVLEADSIKGVHDGVRALALLNLQRK